VKRVEGREPRVESRARTLVFRNRQSNRPLNIPLLRRITRHLLGSEFGLSKYELGFHFVAETEMARINEQFLRHEGSTDVITFDHGSSAHQLHGEIFISVPDAVKQAREFRTTWQSEVVRYVIHGLLHLRGYDDSQSTERREMKRVENRLLRDMTSKFSLRELAGARKS
jgi:probable rRNA maturation factor